MAKRAIKFGDYDTAVTGLWTLTGWTLSSPEQQTNFIEVPGRRSGLLDLSTAMTDGEPIYNSRTLKATFESSEGTRLEREARINTMLNTLDGYSMKIVLPDDSTHYMVGRVTVKKNYNDNAHAAVEVSAVCEPWRYNATRQRIGHSFASVKVAGIRITIGGRSPATPTVEVIDADSEGVTVQYEGYSWVLSTGTYVLTPIVFLPGVTHEFRVSGQAGTLRFYWSEGEL